MSDSSTIDPPSLGLRLIELGDERELRRGEVLFNQRDPASSVFWVRLGRLRLERHLAGGQVVTLSVATAPTVVAEAALFSANYHCRAVAEIASLIAVVPKTVVLDLLRDDASFAASFVHALATEVRTVRHLLELRNVRPASERLLSYLAFKQDAREPLVDRPLSALASELGLTPEALYRIVAKLTREGVIRRHGRRLELSDGDKT